MLRPLLVFAPLILLAGCGGSRAPAPHVVQATPGHVATDDDANDYVVATHPPPPLFETATPAELAKYIYVLSDSNELYTFSPAEKKLTRVGRLACDTDMQPCSMAIDRNGIAWVAYVKNDGVVDVDARIFQVSPRNAACRKTNLRPGKEGWFRLGMGYAADDASKAGESLFITAEHGRGLARIDFDEAQVNPIGRFFIRDHEGVGVLGERPARKRTLLMEAELTGTGDGRLFGFFRTRPVRVAEIDKRSGELLSMNALDGVETPSSWAFSFWGGDFYLYTAPPFGSRTSNITRYTPRDEKAGKEAAVDAAYMTNVGIRIVGAGVSTYAPVH